MSPKAEFSTVQEVSHAVEYSKQASACRAMHGTTSRVDALREFKKLVVSSMKEFCAAAEVDLGRDQIMTEVSEFHLILSEIDYMIANLGTLSAVRREPLSLLNFPGTSSEIHRVPLGTVLVIGAWNYPFYTTLQPAAAALAAGNVVLIKPSEVSIACSDALRRVFSVDRLPTGLPVRVLTGDAELTKALISDSGSKMKLSSSYPLVDHVCFTGSTLVGKEVAKRAMDYFIPCTLELGGKCPTIVSESANIKVAARRIAFAKFALNSGQICVAPDYLIVAKPVFNGLVKEMKAALKEFLGSRSVTWSSDTMSAPQTSSPLGRIINSRHLARLTKIADSCAERIAVLNLDVCYQATYLLDEAKTNEAVSSLHPCLVDFSDDIASFKSSSCMKEEIFGPILPVILYDPSDLCSVLGKVFSSAEEESSTSLSLLNLANPLSAYVFSGSDGELLALRRVIRTGSIVLNDAALHIAEPELPFGGVGTSGMGRIHGKSSFDAFTYEQCIVRKQTWLDLFARYPPYNGLKICVLRLVGQLVRLGIRRRKAIKWWVRISILLVACFGLLSLCSSKGSSGRSITGIVGFSV